MVILGVRGCVFTVVYRGVVYFKTGFVQVVLFLITVYNLQWHRYQIILYEISKLNDDFSEIHFKKHFSFLYLKIEY